MGSRRLFGLLGAGLAATILACEKPSDGPSATASAQFGITVSATTRAPESLNPSTYTARLYMFKESTAANGSYTYFGETNITNGSLTISDLALGTEYRFVFMAVPKSQQPALPDLSSAKPAYRDAIVSYISGVQTGNEIFRCIYTFTPTVGINRYTAVLTRQNGALQIRLNNADASIRTARLELPCQPKIYLNDGTGGEVVSSGTAITLTKSANVPRTSDYRISINTLPTEDLTGKGRLTLTLSNGSQRSYSLASTSGRIPIYPNQITWLTFDGTSCLDTATQYPGPPICPQTHFIIGGILP